MDLCDSEIPFQGGPVCSQELDAGVLVGPFQMGMLHVGNPEASQVELEGESSFREPKDG